MSFYDCSGNRLSVEEFVDYYSSAYSYNGSRIESIRYSQSSPFIEEQVEQILCGHIKEYKDLARIIAWKIGKIRHKESRISFIYAKDWVGCEERNPMRFGKEMQLKNLCNFILKNIECLEKMAITNPQECLNVLRDESVDGIGTVYLITLLFFLSHGKQPIYDRFAMTALIAYEKNYKVPKDKKKLSCNEKIVVPMLPGKTEDSFSEIYLNEYGEYIKRLDSLGVDYKNKRKVDQALWVYGHAFI